LLAASVGLRPLIFAASVGSKPPLFASRSDLVCGPLQLGLVTASVLLGLFDFSCCRWTCRMPPPIRAGY
jgi:hypothetical protein